MPKTDHSPTGLDALYLEKLKSSLLDKNDAALLQFKLLYAEHSPDYLPAPAGGFEIPYFDVEGNVTEFVRYRMLEQPKLAGFSAAVERKPMRYAQPPGTLNEVYLPPIIPWREVVGNASIPICITEGELKAACATKLSPYPTIGLGGVWCFRSSKAGFAFLPQLEEFTFADRLVYIMFDSDAVTNPEVCAAENELARQLTTRGAQVKIIRIPAAVGAKMGIDDYLLAGKSFDKLTETASEFLASQELHSLNEEVLYVRDPGFILRLETNQQIRPSDFSAHAYSTRTFEVHSASPKGNKIETKSAAKEWLKWPHRATVEKLTYAPGAPIVTDKGEYNLWRGWGVAPKKGNIDPWTRLLDHLFDDETESRVWFERWLAFPLQNPGVKMYTAPLVWGTERGTGKSFVGYSMFKIYGDNANEVLYRQLHGSFTAWAVRKQFIMIDDAESSEKRQEHGQLRHIITRQSLTMNQKYVPEFTIPDVLNYYITANSPDTLHIEDNERRYFIHEVRAKPKPRDFYRDYEAWIGAANVTGPGAAALFEHLLTLDLGGMAAADRAPETNARADMIDLSRSDIGVFCKRLLDDPDSILRHNGKVIKHKLWTSEELLMFYDPDNRKRVTSNGLTREMRRLGKHRMKANMQFDTHIGRVRLWEIRDTRAQTRDEITALYDGERGHAPPKTKASTPHGKKDET